MPNFQNAEGSLTPEATKVTFSGDIQPSALGEDHLGLGSVGVTSVSQTTMTYSGPVPSYEEMAGYAAIDPNFPNRILKMAEENAAAERKGALRQQTYSFVSDLSGRVLGAIFAITAILIASYLAMNGHETTASVVGGATVVAVAAALITGRRSDAHDD